jgi:hypothetical protein
MINKRYFDFKESLNENVQQAKVYLKNLALKKKKEAAGETEGPVGLSADEVRAAETNPSFVKIKDDFYAEAERYRSRGGVCTPTTHLAIRYGE